MEPCFLVAAEGVIDLGQLQAHPGEFRSFREDRLEPPGRASGKALPGLDQAEQKQPLNAFLVVFGPRLFQQLARVFYPAGPEEDLSGPDGRDVNALARDIAGVDCRRCRKEQ